MDLEKLNTEEISVFYDKTRLILSEIEADFLALEKEYFQITPLYEKIFQKIHDLEADAANNQATLLKYRLNRLAKELIRFHHTSGYNSESFHSLFHHLREINKKLSDEIFSESAISLIREKVKMEASKWIPDGLPAKSNLHKYLAVKSEDMFFIVPFKRKIWEKKVENRKKLKIQIKSLPGNNIFTFHSLLNLDSQNMRKDKLGILLETEEGKYVGILADAVEGVMIFSEKFMKKHTDHFPIGEGSYLPYIHVKGQRYFLKKPD